MAGNKNAAPVIIKRKKIIAGGGHHGGAWKVAYADFVTAMMAFFLLMWLLGATNEKQRKGVANYFNPSVAMSPSGAGDGVMGGNTPMPERTANESGTGFEGGRIHAEGPESDTAGAQAQKEAVDKALAAYAGESLTMKQLLPHVVTRVSDEGLVIEVFDLDDRPLFYPDTADPKLVLPQIARMFAVVLDKTPNGIAINGHVRSYPMTMIDNPVWRLSAARAEALRDLMQRAGLSGSRLQRVTGHADRKPVAPDPMSIRNNRLEIILLRKNR